MITEIIDIERLVIVHSPSYNRLLEILDILYRPLSTLARDRSLRFMCRTTENEETFEVVIETTGLYLGQEEGRDYKFEGHLSIPTISIPVEGEYNFASDRGEFALL